MSEEELKSLIIQKVITPMTYLHIFNILGQPDMWELGRTLTRMALAGELHYKIHKCATAYPVYCVNPIPKKFKHEFRYSRYRTIGQGGWDDRNDWQDKEPVIHNPVSEFLPSSAT